MEERLKEAKYMNKAAVILVTIMFVLMCFWLVHMQHLAKRYELLEERYTELYQEMTGMDTTDMKMTDSGNGDVD